jgi:hypothetical protein
MAAVWKNLTFVSNSGLWLYESSGSATRDLVG